MSDRLRAYCFLTLAMGIAGSAVVAGKVLVAGVPVFLAAELGVLVSLVFLWPPLLLGRSDRAPLDAKTHLVLFLQSLTGVALYRGFIFEGLRHTTAAAGGLVSSAAPVVIALMAVALLRESASRNRLAGAISVSAGILAVNLAPFLSDTLTAPPDAVKGNCLILAAVLCESAFSVLSKARCRPVSAMRRTAIISTYAALCLAPFALDEALGYDFGLLDPATLACIGYYGTFVSFLSYVFWFKGIALVPAGVAASFTGIVPVSSIFLSWAVLHERITVLHWTGLAFLLAGIVLACGPRGTGSGRNAAGGGA